MEACHKESLFVSLCNHHFLANDDIPNVELIRVNDGATGASHQACLRKTPDPAIGSA